MKDNQRQLLACTIKNKPVWVKFSPCAPQGKYTNMIIHCKKNGNIHAHIYNL